MTELFLQDCYMKEFDAKVESVKDGKFIVLDQTTFYPNAGGQPYDTGKLVKYGVEFPVVFVGKFSGKISHEVKGEGLQEGDSVHGIIDWDRRYKLMRMHTAAHIIANFIEKKTGAQITGNQLGLEKSRIDFSLEDFDKEQSEQFIKNANEIVEKALPLHFNIISREEAPKVLGEHWTTLAKGFPEHIKEIRVVQIEDFATEACGGTHVNNTEEVGKIKFLKAQNKGANNRRIYFTLE